METGGKETLYAYLERRERELTHQLTTLRAQVEARETELAHVKSAKRQIGNFGSTDKARLGVPTPSEVDEQVSVSPIPMPSQYQTASIKDLVLRALYEHFREGATPAQLREFFRDAYGRSVDRGSLSPQLTRLREDEVVERDGSVWKLPHLQGSTERELKERGIIPPWASMKLE